MLPNLPLPRIFGPVHCDAPEPVSSLKQTIKSAVTVRETELGRWRRTFDANAKTEVEGQKCVRTARRVPRR
jgi:solute carrier family 25 aspartate/glutamate transporter 12/13